MDNKEYLKKLREIDEKIDDLEIAKRDLKRAHSSYYIVVIAHGNGDYWDEYFYPIGFVTDEQAEKWLEKETEENNSVSWCDTHYFPVGKDVYKAYLSYSRLNEARESIMNLSYAPIPGLVDAEFSSGVVNRLEEKMKELNEKHKLFKHTSYQHIEKEVYI